MSLVEKKSMNENNSFCHKKVLLITLMMSLLTTSCYMREDSKKYNYIDSSIPISTDVFLYHNMRFTGVQNSINTKTKYTYFYIDCFVINNDSIVDRHCEVDFVLDSQNLYYTNCDLKTYSQTNYSVDTKMFCLRFDDLEDSSQFPEEIKINIRIDNKMIRIIDPSFLNNFCIWAPLLDSTFSINSFKYQVCIEMWEGFQNEDEDYTLHKQAGNNVPPSYKQYQNGDCFVINKSFDSIGAFFNHDPIGEIECTNDSFLVS